MVQSLINAEVFAGWPSQNLRGTCQNPIGARTQIGEKTLSYTPHESTRIRVVLTIFELGTTKVLFLHPNLARRVVKLDYSSNKMTNFFELFNRLTELIR